MLKKGNHFKCSKQVEVDGIMFSNRERYKMITDYNECIPNMFTSKGTGIKYFKDKVLKKKNEMH